MSVFAWYEKYTNTIDAGKILDIGAGMGGGLIEILSAFRSFEEAIGIDNDPTKIQIANKRYCINDERVSFKIADASLLDYNNEVFDTITMINTLHHLSDEVVHRTITEALRVLKANGIFIIIEMNDIELDKSQQMFMSIHEITEQLNGISNVVYRKPESIISLLHYHGFKVNKIDTFRYYNQNAFDYRVIEDVKSILDKVINRCNKIENIKIRDKAYELKNKLDVLGFRRASENIYFAEKISL